MSQRSCLSGPPSVSAVKEETSRSQPILPENTGGKQPRSPLPEPPAFSSCAPPVPPFRAAARADATACRRVTSRVAEDFGVTLAELAAPSRGSPRAALARQVAMYLCHIGYALNFEAVGRLFSRDRTTVAHACRVVEDRRDDRWFDRRVALLERACGFALPCDREERA